MRPPRSLKGRVALWFAAALLALYGTAATLGWLYARTTARQYALLVLKDEVETAASYIAGTGRFDAAEFTKAERDPIPLWLRAIDGGAVVRATPGLPPVPVLRSTSGETITTATFRAGGTTYMIVHHRVGGSRPGTAVEAIGSLTPLIARERRLGGALVLAGVLVIPLAVVGGRRLAGRALRPLEHLVESIRGLEPSDAAARLDIPGDVVTEIDVLTRAFNDLLGRLQETMESMRRFTADASHEIRNPLTIVKSGLEIALRRERTPEQYRTLLRENLQEIERLHAVLEGLLAMARSGAGHDYPLRRDPADLSEIVTRTVSGFETVAVERSIALAASIAPNVIVGGDAALLRLVVFNLVDNAIKHGPAGQAVEILLEGGADEARLLVADHGGGVPGDVRERLFERFNRPAGNSIGGLGLSVVRWVTELHGGEVRLLESPDGARFEVTLPVRCEGA